MKPIRVLTLVLFLLVTGFAIAADQKEKPKGLEKSFKGANDLNIMVKATKPQDLDTDLQIIGYFKHKPKGDTVLDVMIQFDNLTGNVISSLRNRGDFVGEALETIVFTPPKGAMKPKQLMMIGYGDENTLKVQTMAGIGTTSVREAMRLGAKTFAFAPAIRDQGNDKFGTGEVEYYNVKGMILAYDTEMRLQKQGLAKPFKLEQIYIEAGPEYFKATIAGVEKGVTEANAEVAKRGNAPFGK